MAEPTCGICGEAPPSMDLGAVTDDGTLWTFCPACDAWTEHPANPADLIDRRIVTGKETPGLREGASNG